MPPPTLRFRKLCFSVPTRSCFDTIHYEDNVIPEAKHPKKPKRRRCVRWSCFDSCFWAIGYVCTAWWLLLFIYNSIPVPAMLQAPEPPGTRLSREGVKANHPGVLVPGIVTGGLELWEGRPCAEGLFRKRLWGGSFTEILRRPLCWLEHLSLDSETGLDPLDIRVRAARGLVAADDFAPSYFAWAVLIKNLAKIGYEGKNLHMASYDWRLSFHNTEVRDQSLSRLKSKIELMYVTNGYKKVVVVPHSMGAIYFLHFLKWVETPLTSGGGGGGGGSGWCAKHIKAVLNIGPTFLGVPKAVSNLLSGEGKDIAYARALSPGLLDSELVKLQTLEYVLRMSHSWDSIVSLLPKGGEAIWGDLDWSPEEEDHTCIFSNRKSSQPLITHLDTRNISTKPEYSVKETVKYGRIIAFGKRASQLPSSQLSTLNIKDLQRVDDTSNGSTSCGQCWSEYNEMNLEKAAENKAYTATTVLDLIRFIAPKMMKRAEAHFSHGIAHDLEDPKYEHYKYWSNPLESKLPDAPDMEMHCLYGVGIPTERSYIYRLSTSSNKCKRTIPFRIDGSVVDGDDACIKGGVRFVDGDESVPVISAGYMCAKGWRGKTRFNPSGMETFVREYKHKAPGSLLESRGNDQSGAHVEIMGNVGLIEDVMRIASGASGHDIGGDRVYSNVMRMSKKVRIKL